MDFYFLFVRKFSGFAKILIIILLALSISGSVFVFPQRADAQFASLRIPQIAENIWKVITTASEKIYNNAAAAAFKTALSQFLNKMAYDMAVAVATGAPGQKSLIFDDPNYFINLGGAVMGNAVDEIAQESGFTNLLGTTSLCEPADLTTKVNLLLSFKTPTEPVKPSCSLSQMKKSLAESANSFTNSFSLQNLSLRFEMGDLEEARNSLRQALTVEKYLSSGAAIDNELSDILTRLEGISDETAGLIQSIYQKPIDDRQAAADSELEKLSNLMARLNQTQNEISELKGTIVYCNSSAANCAESSAAGMCVDFISIGPPPQMNCSAAVQAAQTYIDQFQKFQTDLTEGVNNFYTGVLEKAFTVPDASDPQDIANAFNPPAHDMGKYFLIKEAKDRNINVKIENEKLLQRISKDCEPKKDPISGMNVLPSSAACGMFNFAMSKATVNEETYTGTFSQAISIFTNTLAGKLLQNWFEKGVASLYNKGKGKNTTSAADLASGGAPRGKGAAEEKFLTLLQSNFTAGGPFEVLKELTVCPEKGAGPNNCIIDSDFSQAIAERLTLKEAMDKKLLDPKKPFGYIKSGSILVEPSYLSGYPYRSMIVLRKFRIIPVGWELAAEWIKDPGKNTDKISYTLKQVVDCYENGPQCVFDPNPNPFYHLVDPGWVFLEQPAFCKRQGAGEKILAEEFVCSQPDTANRTCSEYSRSVYRQEYCADEQTCLLKNDDGSCRFYGYCSLDQPTWKLDGASCNQEYNSCQTYGNEDGANVSYLEHTISNGGCNSGNANCQWYCEEAPLVCSGGSQNGEPCSSNDDCAPTAGGIVDGVCRPTDLWKCQGKNLIGNGGVEINSNGWIGFGTGSNNRIDTSGHESFANLSSADNSSNESGWRSLPISFYGGESVDASGWVNISVAGGGASIRLRNLTANTIIAESEIITELNIWKPVHLAASISADANMALELVAYNNATAMFDDIGFFRGSRISFDKDVKQCEAKDAGCHEFARTTNGANLIFNPSFEIEEKRFSETPAASDWYGWYGSSTGSISRDESIQNSGKASLQVDVGVGPAAVIGAETPDPRSAVEADYKQMLEDSYVFSVYAKAQTACAGNCLSLVGDCKVGAGGESQQAFQLTASWERYSFSYAKSKIANDGNECRFYVLLNPLNTYWLDDAKLEIGTESAGFKDYGSEKIYLNESRLSCDLTEVGCELYAPDNGEAGIPAVARLGDQCLAECVGYETYHEIPSYFDPLEDAVPEIVFPNLIPSTAVQCSAQAAGCEEFTNLDTVASGGEAKEYYTYIRQCAKPGTTDEATYYTWEGSEEAGFQLRAWKFKAYADGSPFAIDSPLPPVDCDLSDPDCRVFYNQTGDAFQRFLSKTVSISTNCQPLRRTIEGTTDDCDSSGGYNWEDTGTIGDNLGTCYYNVIPTQGLKCEQKFANCREYKGPSANSQQSLFKYDFEDIAQTGDWTLASRVTESVSVGGHSLEISVGQYDTERDIFSLVDKTKTYLVKFWAKPDPANINSAEIFAQFYDGSSSIDSAWTTLLPDWNAYILGPLDFTTRDPGVSEKLIINSDEAFYIDNIELIEAGDDSFVIKNSWKTPVSCDLNPLGVSKNLSTGGPDLNATDIIIPLNDIAGLPSSGDILIDSEVISYDGFIGIGVSAVRRGERGTTSSIHSNGAKVLFLEPGYALHCSAYTDRANNIHNLKSFSKLCREDHVGCELLADTQNSSSPFAEWKSAEYIPADGLTSIVNDDKKYCDAKSKGCQKFGRPELDADDNTTGWNSAYFINNPDDYKEILCQNIENWCKEYKTPDGAEKYFKDPGEKLCEYKENIGVGNTVTSGWFIKGQYDIINPPECAGAMRHCSISKNGSYLYCRTNPDCQPIGKNGLPENLGICIAKDTEWVRECPESQSSCTEYIDPLFSRTQGVKDRYYYLSDTIDEGKCKGKIDEEQKCVAFNKSEDPIRNTRASGTCKIDPNIYCTTNAECTGGADDVCLMVSDRPFEPQACVRCSADQLSCNPDPTKSNPCCSAVTAAGQIACSANSILYVQKDRDCREWLSCVSSAKITNGKGEKEEVCYDVARCTEIDPVTGACLAQATDVNYCQNNPAKLCASDAQCMENIGPCNQLTGRCVIDGTRVCTKDYQCFNDEGPCIADSQTFDSPLQTDVPPHAGVVDDLRYRSGFNPYGLHWLDGDADPSNDPLRNGEYLQTATIQKGQVTLFEDGDFEKQDSLWSRFSTCSNTSLGAGRQCVNNSSCHAGDICDLGSGNCSVSGFSCINNNQCNISDSCGGVCSNNASVRCRDDSNCTAPGTCDLTAMVCYVNGNTCRNDNVILLDPSDDFADDAMCAGLDVCSNPRDFEYERIKVLSGLRSLKLGPGESAFQGNYPGAVNFNDNAPIFVTGSSQIAFSGYINTADLKSGEARVIIQEFKNGATAFEYAKGPITMMKQGPNKSWTFYAGIFITDPEAVSIRVVLEVAAGSAGSAYFDNFLMLPVLNYQNQSYPIPFLEVYEPDDLDRPGDNPFIGRSCRLYPQTSAPACSYTDEQKQQFLGWRGFCVEPDPSNPLQCLQWLPIDQIQGETGLGFKTESSYSGRTPLYYCAEMSLWQLRCNGYSEKHWNGYSQDECPTKSSIDPSCPIIYAARSVRQGSKLKALFSPSRHNTCYIRGFPTGYKDFDCFWVPYQSCPYGTRDMAKDISPNLIGRCDKLVEVIDSEGQNMSWANRLDQKIFEFATPYGYIYNADQNSPLYGSILAMGQSNQSPESWQTMFGEEFIRFGTTVRDDTTIGKNNGLSANPTYPLWIVPKSEDIKTCTNDNSIICSSDAQCSGGNCVANDAMACTLSSGGSPAACNSSYCYNNAPAPLQPSPQCSATDTNRSFQLNVSQLVRPQIPNAAQKSKNNKETFIQGVQRIQHLFAKSYASYVWNAGQCSATDPADVCTGVCSDDGVTRCIDDTYCPTAAPGVCQTNQETGNSCELAATGYRCSGNTQKPCINEADPICANSGWGSCVLGAFADDCNLPSGKCTPAGGGVCQDSSTGYIGKVCSPTCLGGSCLQLGNCTIGGASCDLGDPTNCANGVNGPCINSAWECQGGVNSGAACDQTNDCTNSGISVSCVSGGGNCVGGFLFDTCSGGDFNGLDCDVSGNVTITAETCVNKRCFNGTTIGGFCPGTGADSNGDGVGDAACDTASGEYCRNPADIGAPAQVCSPGGYDVATGEYTGLGACANDADCTGTTSYNSCFTFNNRCAIIEDLGDPDRVRGIEKAGSYCDNLNNNPCRSADGLDNGVCATNWCSDGPFMQFQCANTNPDCLLIGPEYTYVNAADIDDPAPDPRFSQTLWNPPSNQCSNPVGFLPINNQRPYAVQPPDKDIRLETGEMCGVAPRIRFIKKPGDSSVPVDIEIDAGNSATINFLTMIDAEQKPIRNIRIDWGTANDVSDQIGVGPYADGTGLAPKTLDSDPFIFTSSPYQMPGTYTVKVMVQDNWGWCNGTTDGAGFPESGCSSTVSTNWLEFPGRIIVKP